jgi:hypothetical protein
MHDLKTEYVKLFREGCKSSQCTSWIFYILEKGKEYSRKDSNFKIKIENIPVLFSLLVLLVKISLCLCVYNFIMSSEKLSLASFHLHRPWWKSSSYLYGPLLLTTKPVQHSYHIVLDSSKKLLSFFSKWSFFGTAFFLSTPLIFMN